MGHYASEMDPEWGQPKPHELKLASVEDERVRDLAKALFASFNSSSHLDVTNAEAGIRVAEAIDELIRTRVEEIAQRYI